MKTLSFNRQHKNGWVSFKLAGVPGAVYIDRRMFVEGGIPTVGSTIELDVPGLQEPGAGATEAQAAKDAKKLERETLKAEKAQKASEKAAARLAKLQENATKAAEKAAAATAKASGAAGSAPAAV